MNVTQLIIIGSCLPVFATVALALLRYKSFSTALRIFSWFLFISGIIQAISLVLWFMNKNNMPLLHVYVATGFLSLALFYKHILHDFIGKRLMISLIVGFLCFTIFNSLFIQSIYTFNSHARTLESILIIIFSLSTLMLAQHEVTKESKKQAFISLNWINSGLLIFYASNILIFYFGESLINFFPSYMNEYAWVLHSFFSAIAYCCFFVGLWKSQKN
jgi:hypothetical protein